MIMPNNSENHWAYIAETGTTLGMQILIFAYRVGGSILFKLFLFPVMVFYFLLRSDSRQASGDYLNRVYQFVPGSPKVTLALKFAHFWQFALALIDKFAIWMGEISRDDMVMHNLDIIDDLVAKKQGAIFAISHLGNFEILSAMSQRHSGVKLTVLHHTKHAEKFNRLLNKYSKNSDVELLQVTEINAALGMRLSEKIQRGEFIAVAADRVPISNKKATVSCDFLGAPANFPTGPFILAITLSVPIVMLVCIREQGVYHAYFDIIAEAVKVNRSQRSEFMAKSAQSYASRLESYVCKAPLQWFNFFDFWHKR
jgi:predicted LPLAT superfamily acyltransferase